MPKKSIQALTGRDIRCLLFDLGETLWFRKDKTVWKQLEAEANLRAVMLLRKHVPSISLPAGDDKTLGERLREAFDEHIRILIRWNPAIEPNGPLAVMRVLTELGIEGVDSTFSNAIFEALRVPIPESRPLFNDTLPTLAALQQRSFLLGVVSNRIFGGAAFQEDLHTLGLLDYFDPRHMAISGDLGIRKPNPAIFLHTLNALNVPPQQAAMVGDSLSKDIIGARQLGIFAVWKPKPKERAHLDDYLAGEIQPDLIIKHLSDLLDYFLKADKQ